MPAAALSLMSIFFIIKKRLFVAGIFLSLAILTKNSIAFFIPGLILILFLVTKERIMDKIKNAIIVFIPTSLLLLFDFQWRMQAFSKASLGIIQGTSPLPLLQANQAATGISQLGSAIQIGKFIVSDFIATRVVPNTIGFKKKPMEYLNSHLFNINDLVRYLGIVLVVLFIFYLLFKKNKKNDAFHLVLMISYFVCCLLTVGMNTDIRYLLPIIPFLSILLSPLIPSIKSDLARRIVVSLCIVQFLASSVYVFNKRNISPGTQEAFNFIKNNTPRDSLIVYLEPNIQEYAERKLIWSNFKAPTSLKDIFWPGDLSQLKNAITVNNIDYIAIKKTRCYDDNTVHHFGGYPNSFVKNLPHYDFVKLIFDNKEIALWKITDEK
jgi:hypothetical protein